MSYFYSETNEWLHDGAKQWAILWSATTSHQFHSKFHFIWKISMKKKWLVAARNLQIIKTLLTLELSQYRESGSTFSSSEPVAARSDCHRLGNALCLCLPVCPAQAVPERDPKSSAFDLQSKTSIVFWNHSLSLLEWLPNGLQGAQTWTQTWTLPPDQRVVKVLSALKSQNKLCGVWIPFKGQLLVDINPHPPDCSAVMNTILLSSMEIP